MGNKRNRGIEIINPSSLHEHVECVEGVWRYVPSVGRDVALYVAQGDVTLSRHRDRLGRVVENATFGDYKVLDELEITLLDELEVKDKKPVLREYRVTEVLDQKLNSSLGGIDFLQGNMVVVTHGRMWGLEPERRVAAYLRSQGFYSPDVFVPRGGKNRILSHAIGYQREKPEVQEPTRKKLFGLF